MSNAAKWIAMGLGLCLGVGHAWGIEPEPGMWGIDAEVNGKPGRGVQIDTQSGKFIIITYFGYRADGSALFLQASGERTDTGFQGDLVEYQGGPVLGGAQRSGEPAASAGRIAVVFTSSITGTITLPGEVAKPISRFQFEDNSRRFNRNFLGMMTVDSGANGWSQRYYFQLQDDKLTLDRRSSIEGNEFFQSCTYTGTYALAGGGIRSRGTYTCADGSTGPYETDQLHVSRDGFYTGTFLRTRRSDGFVIREYHHGACNNGFLSVRCTFQFQ